jgi:lysozyme
MSVNSNLYKKLLGVGLASSLALSGSFLIAPSEGLVTKTYLDPVNIITGCRGHTGPELKLGQTFTVDQCDKIFADDLIEHDKILLSVVKVPMTAYQHAAFLSFLYNVGPGKKGVKDGFVHLKKTGAPSSMLRKLNAGDYDGACNEFLSWMQEGQGMSGIEKRRRLEMAMCKGQINYENN